MKLPPAFDPSKVPAPDDLPGWKEADKRLAQRMAQCLEEEDLLWSSRAVDRYFGEDDLEYYFTKHMQRGVAQAYTTWGVLDYRPTKAAKTRAQKMLAEGLPEPQAVLLRASMEAHPTLYRVAGHDARAGTIELEDVLLGGSVTVHDRLMSENIEDGLFLAARTFPAGRFHFIAMAGPPLGQGMGMEAVEFLQDVGMAFTREGLRRDAHMLGWLWAWSDESEANWRPPRLANMDGEELLWHTASFSVADWAGTRQALLDRADLAPDGEDEFVWSAETGKAAKMMGGSVILGRVELVGDELVLTTNSAERLAAGRAWLERLPGVVFRAVATRSLDAPDHDRPMDERISEPESVEITPELAADLQEMMEKRYMAWLDTSLPMLDGKTPRETCRTPAGRQQIATLIRTIPEPIGPVPIRVPRQAMMRDLGLVADLSPQAAAGPLRARPAVAADSPLSGGKVGRNEPCPCGSGRKFKKCCGK